MKLTNIFYKQSCICLAKSLLGKKLVRNYKGQLLSGMIVETEAYLGETDSACHSSKGKTKRTETMYNRYGTSYVYMIYGMYYMFNIVAEDIGNPQAILIRAIEPIDNIEIMQKLRKANLKNLTNGPGKLCDALKIDKSLNDIDLINSNQLWLENFKNIKDDMIESGKRIGINYAEDKDKNALLRFWIKNNKFVSKS